MQRVNVFREFLKYFLVYNGLQSRLFEIMKPLTNCILLCTTKSFHKSKAAHFEADNLKKHPSQLLLTHADKG